MPLSAGLKWGLSPLDWHDHAIDEYADHPTVCVRRPLRVLTDGGHHAAREPTEPDLPVLRPVGRLVSRQHPGESYRHAIDVRRPSEYGGGTCTVLVRRIDGRVELLFHACPETGAVLSPAQAIEIAAALTEAAAENRSTSSQ